MQLKKKEILYLGHIVNKNGITPDTDKIKALNQYPVPKNAEEVKRFVAFANYYRKFKPKFAELSVPLTKLFGRYAIIKWTDKCKKSFQFLKNALHQLSNFRIPRFFKRK